MLLNGHRLAHGTLLARGLRQVKHPAVKPRIKGGSRRVRWFDDARAGRRGRAGSGRGDRDGPPAGGVRGRRLAHAGDEALVKARVYPYDLICLDLNLPGVGRARGLPQAPAESAPTAAQPRMLMLTARGGVDDRIAGLDDGADDYLVKPFELGELAARARALLRREGDAASTCCASASSSSTRRGTRRRRAASCSR